MSTLDAVWLDRPDDGGAGSVEVLACPRCGGRHPALPVTPFARPSPTWRHWGSCPETAEPILFGPARAGPGETPP